LFDRVLHDLFSISLFGSNSQKNCGTTVQKALEAVEGVTSAAVVFAEKRAFVRSSSSASSLIDAVQSVGFDATVVGAPVVDNTTKIATGSSLWQPAINVVVDIDEAIVSDQGEEVASGIIATYSVTGMKSARCAAAIEKGLAKRSATIRVKVALLSEKAEVKMPESMRGQGHLIVEEIVRLSMGQTT
jgi:cation transport ATPase